MEEREPWPRWQISTRTVSGEEMITSLPFLFFSLIIFRTRRYTYIYPTRRPMYVLCLLCLASPALRCLIALHFTACRLGIGNIGFSMDISTSTCINFNLALPYHTFQFLNYPPLYPAQLYNKHIHKYRIPGSEQSVSLLDGIEHELVEPTSGCSPGL